MGYTRSRGIGLDVCDPFGWCSEDNMSYIMSCIVLVSLWNKFEKILSVMEIAPLI